MLLSRPSSTQGIAPQDLHISGAQGRAQHPKRSLLTPGCSFPLGNISWLTWNPRTALRVTLLQGVATASQKQGQHGQGELWLFHSLGFPGNAQEHKDSFPASALSSVQAPAPRGEFLEHRVESAPHTTPWKEAGASWGQGMKGNSPTLYQRGFRMGVREIPSWKEHWKGQCCSQHSWRGPVRSSKKSQVGSQHPDQLCVQNQPLPPHTVCGSN